MPTNFKPVYRITPGVARNLMRIEAAKEKVSLLPVNPTVLASLRETAKLFTTHYSTMIEGNQLKPDEIKEVIQLQGHFPGRERDEHEVKGYYAALAQIEQYVSQNRPVTEKVIQTLHALVIVMEERVFTQPLTETDKMLSQTVAQEQSCTCRQKPKMYQVLCIIWCRGSAKMQNYHALLLLELPITSLQQFTPITMAMGG